MPEPNLESIKDQIELLKHEIADIENHIPKWDAHSTRGGKLLRSISKRIVLSTKRLEALVKENTYSP
jgi:ribosomal protein S15P/S13E